MINRITNDERFQRGMIVILSIIFVVLLISWLSACAPIPQAGYGGYDPETQNLLAIATQTGAAARISQTEAAKQATAQAIYAQQTAVSSYATATQQASDNATMQAIAQETAVSATETAVYLPVGVQQTTEAQAVLMARENEASTATAVAIRAEIEENAKAAERWDKFWIGFFIFLAGLGVSVVLLVIGMAFRTIRPVPAVYDDNGNVVGLPRNYLETQHARRPVIIQNPEYQPPKIEAPVNNMQASRPVTFSNRNGETKIEVNDRNPEIDPFKWQCFAAAVLVDGVPPTRRAITEANAYISQSDHKAMYDYLIENNLARTGAGDALILDIGEGYEFLYNKLPTHMQREVTLPHPGGLEPVSG